MHNITLERSTALFRWEVASTWARHELVLHFTCNRSQHRQHWCQTQWSYFLQHCITMRNSAAGVQQKLNLKVTSIYFYGPHGKVGSGGWNPSQLPQDKRRGTPRTGCQFYSPKCNFLFTSWYILKSFLIHALVLLLIQTCFFFNDQWLHYLNSLVSCVSCQSLYSAVKLSPVFSFSSLIIVWYCPFLISPSCFLAVTPRCLILWTVLDFSRLFLYIFNNGNMNDLQSINLNLLMETDINQIPLPSLWTEACIY